MYTNSPDENFKQEATTLLYSMLASGTAAQIAIALPLVIFLWPVIDPVILVGWLLTLISINLIRFISSIFYKKKLKNQSICIDKWHRAFLGLLLINSTCWASILLFPYPIDNAIYLTFSSLVLIGISSGAVIPLSANILFVTSYLVLILVPLTFTHLFQGTTFSYYESLFAFVFLIFSIFNARRSHETIKENILIKYKYEEQNESLSQLNNELEKHKSHLVTDINKKISDLKIARDQAIKANESKSEFLGNMSHELRTPIHGIIGFAKLIQSKLQKGDIPKADRFAKNIHESANRLLDLVNNLLDLSKLESHHDLKVFTTINLQELTEQVIKEFQGVIESRNSKIYTEFPNEQTNFTGNDSEIKQVIRNLISNAIKYSDENTSIQIILRGAHEGKNYWVFEILDEGVGIPSVELETIFDKFIQSSKTKSGAGGTGLGLSICKKIITKHGGEIVAKNREPKGTIVQFKLPTHLDETNSN